MFWILRLIIIKIHIYHLFSAGQKFNNETAVRDMDLCTSV